MRFIKGLAVGFCLLTSNLYASSQDEISHLLEYVAATDCKYERNGKIYDGDKAQAHIRKKYDYFYDDIKTTEDFIFYSATKSKMSGKYYKIHCLGQLPVKSQDWLLTELKRYRANKKNEHK